MKDIELDIQSIEGPYNEDGEQIYDFEFTENQIRVLKTALCCSGLEFNRNRELFKMLCTAVCDKYDIATLKRYE